MRYLAISVLESLLAIVSVVSLLAAQDLPAAPGEPAHPFFPSPGVAAPVAVPMTIQWRAQADIDGGQAGKLQALADVWRKADSEPDREQVRNIASDILAEVFESDMRTRQEELQQIEARVDRLRSQLQKRIDSKEEIIELQVKQITMSWDGLGWTGASPADAVGVVSARAIRAGAPSPPRGLFDMARPAADPVAALLLDAVKRGDAGQIEFLAARLNENLKGKSPEQVNETLWQVFRAARDEVDSEAFWRTMVATGETALEQQGDTPRAANLYDTVAHLHEQLGDLTTAHAYQQKAVELNSSAERAEELRGYLEHLQSEQAR